MSCDKAAIVKMAAPTGHRKAARRDTTGRAICWTLILVYACYDVGGVNLILIPNITRGILTFKNIWYGDNLLMLWCLSMIG